MNLNSSQSSDRDLIDENPSEETDPYRQLMLPGTESEPVQTQKSEYAPRHHDPMGASGPGRLTATTGRTASDGDAGC